MLKFARCLIRFNYYFCNFYPTEETSFFGDLSCDHWGVKIRLSFEETLGHMKTLLLLYSCLCERPQEITQAHDNSTLKRIELFILQFLPCFLSNEQKYIPPHPLPPCKEKKSENQLSQ